jgi:hypothetical protein
LKNCGGLQKPAERRYRTMEETKVYKINQEAPTKSVCDFCDDGIAEYNCYACQRKLCFFCVRKAKDKYLCFFHWKLYQAFHSVEEFKREKGGEKI